MVGWVGQFIRGQWTTVPTHDGSKSEELGAGLIPFGIRSCRVRLSGQRG